MGDEVEIDVNTLLGLIKTDLGEMLVQSRLDLVLARHENRVLRHQMEEQSRKHSEVVAALIEEQRATAPDTSPEGNDGP